VIVVACQSLFGHAAVELVNDDDNDDIQAGPLNLLSPPLSLEHVIPSNPRFPIHSFRRYL
jgi:hypothetical protein